MISRTTVRLDASGRAAVLVVLGSADLADAVDLLELAPRPVVAFIGGASSDFSHLSELFATLAAVVAEQGAIAVSGGTDAGVMRLLGRARSGFPLVGVAAAGTVTYPGHRGANPDAAPLEPHHSHFVLVPGAGWGAEAPSLARTATLLAAGHPAVTVLVNGGPLTLIDAELSLAEGRPVLVVTGTGRLADGLAAARQDPAGCGDSRLAALADSPAVRLVDAPSAAAVLTAYVEGRSQ